MICLLTIDFRVIFHVVYGSRALFCFQAEDGIRELVRSRGLGDVYKRQVLRASGGANKPA